MTADADIDLTCFVTREWPLKALIALREGWSEGLSASVIGKRLGCSRNAVTGKVVRIGLKRRPSPIRRIGDSDGKVPPCYRPIRKCAQFTLPPVLGGGQHVPYEPPAADLLFPTRLCQWIEGDRTGEFCNAQTVSGGSWCSKHRSVVLWNPDTPTPGNRVRTWGVR